MLYIPKIGNYLKSLTDDEGKHFVAINFIRYFKSTKKNLYSKLMKNKILEKLMNLFTSF